MDLHINRDHLAAIFRHVAQCLPAEGVGILGGRDGSRVLRVVPLPNIAADGRTFFADPYAQFLAERELKRDGQSVIGIYHSHPGGGSTLSRLDLDFARSW